MKTLKVIGLSIICGLINITKVNACCCTLASNICHGHCGFDCNFFGCNCGTIDGYCVHYPNYKCGHRSWWREPRCKDPYLGGRAVKSSEYCAARFIHLSMLDSDLISRQEMIEYIVKRNASENTWESNKMLMTFREKFNDIDENKDGYIQPNELDNVNRYT